MLGTDDRIRRIQMSKKFSAQNVDINAKLHHLSKPIYDMREAVPYFQNASKNIDIKMIWMVRDSAFSFVRRRKSLDQEHKKFLNQTNKR